MHESTPAVKRLRKRRYRRLGLVMGLCLIGLQLSCVPSPADGPSGSTQPNPSESVVPDTAEPGGEPGGNAADGNAPEAGQPQASSVGEPGQVLRHAVFFQFKDTSTDEQVQEVVDAFRALPSKIDAITDFCWGVNNSPEGLDDGFTHCFLLTFADAEGRSVYLPHAEHKAFGDVLRPHMERVFVIDYWGTPPESDAAQTPPAKELKHAVFFKFKDDADPADVRAVEEAFAALPGKIESVKALEWGRNNSPEKHSHGFTHCFLVTFDSEEGRAAYLPHADHQAFVKQLEPVLDKVRVLDFWAEK